MKEDPDYRANQEACKEAWLKKKPRYWKEYRLRHPEKTMNNRLKQQIRNQKRSNQQTLEVKVNAKELINQIDQASRNDSLSVSFWLLSTIAEIKPIQVVLVASIKPESHRLSSVSTGQSNLMLEHALDREDP